MIFGTLRARRGLRYRLALTVLVAVLPSTVSAQNKVDEEHLKKAEFISGLPAYAVWPPEALASATAPYIICVYKDWAFTSALANISQSLTFAGHPVEVRKIEKEQDAHGCHIVWVGQAYAKSYPSILSEIRRSPVLTVGEDTVFTEFGGAIALGYAPQSKRATVERINADPVDTGHMRVSSKLVRMARSYMAPPQSPAP